MDTQLRLSMIAEGYGGDVELEDIIESGFGDPPLAWIYEDMDLRHPVPIPNKRFFKIKKHSMFEQLPLEVREIIYSYLGFTIRGNYYCEDSRSGWETWNEKNNYFESSTLDRTNESITKCTNEVKRNGGSFYLREGIHCLANETCYNGLGLLRVNRKIRKELLELTIAVGELTIHGKIKQAPIKRPKTRLKENSLAFWRHTTPDVDFEPMLVSQCLLRCLTSLCLSNYAGRDNAVHSSRVALKRGRRGIGLIQQAKSLCYIATHCPLLAKLDIEPNLDGTYSRYKSWLLDARAPKVSNLNAFCIALSRVIRDCPRLMRVIFPQDLCVSIQEPFGITTWTEIQPLELCLRDVPNDFRAAAARPWIQSSLARLNKGAPHETLSEETNTNYPGHRRDPIMCVPRVNAGGSFDY